MRVSHSHSSSLGHGSLPSLAAWLLVVAIAAAIGGLGSRDAADFYARLQLPAWAPPASVFGPVWTALYASMAVAAWMVWRAPARTPLPLGLFGAQLLVNVLWSWFFFAWRIGVAAAVDIVLLDALVVATSVAFWRVRPLAGAILLPYLAWIAFATALTFSVWQRNPTLL